MTIRTLACVALTLIVTSLWSSQAAALSFSTVRIAGDSTMIDASSSKDDGTFITLEHFFFFDAADTVLGGMAGIFTSAVWDGGNNIFATGALEHPFITVGATPYAPLSAGVTLDNVGNTASQWDYFNAAGNAGPTLQVSLGTITFALGGAGASDGGSAVIAYGTPNAVSDGFLDSSLSTHLGPSATYTIVPAPEPTTLGLLSIGLLSLGLVRHRRN